MFLGVNLTPASGQVAGSNDQRNPLTDPHVREAMSVAMNRQAMVGSLLSGYGAVADQIAVPGMTGHVPDAFQDRFPVERARQLLREAGYAEGFSTSLVCTNNRYVADGETCQAVGQMLARIGIRVAVEAIPPNVYFGRVRAGRSPAPLFLGAWGNSRGDMGYTLGANFHSFGTQAGLGSSNRSGWADPETDREIQAALTERDEAKRTALLVSAHRRAIEGSADATCCGSGCMRIGGLWYQSRSASSTRRRPPAWFGPAARGWIFPPPTCASFRSGSKPERRPGKRSNGGALSALHPCGPWPGAAEAPQA
jgi:peptide/nickel transport system substrate-binding protein